MKKLFKEISIITLIAIMIIALLQFPVNATNDELEIVKTENEYLLYDMTIMENEFDFIFTKDENIEASALDFSTAINSIKDAEGNNVAYIDSTLENTYFKDANGDTTNAYMWIKQGEEVSDPILVDLNTAITQEIIDFVSKTTTRIPVTIGQEEREPITEENTTITTTVGYLQIEAQEGYTYEYQLIELPNSSYTRFVELAKEISNFEENAVSYENISKINEFYHLYNNLVPENWNEVANNRIEQPEDARNGEQYVVWIKATNSTGENIVDVQFMTSVREETEERTTETVKEEVTTTTKLPVTFDSNMILIIVFAVIIVAIIVLLIVRKKLANKSK